MRRAVHAAILAATWTAFAFSPLVMLTKPQKDGDPSFAVSASKTDFGGKVVPFVMTTGETDPTGVTACVWLKTTGLLSSSGGVENWGQDIYLTSFFSPHVSLATREGGPSLSNLLPHAYYQPLQLDASGDWSASNVLPAKYDTLDMGSYADKEWTNGCFCVNVETDAELTLTVAGTEKTVSPSPSMQIFNMNDLGASRDVSVHAPPGSTVRLGIAVNPLAKFFGENVPGKVDVNTSGVNMMGVNDSEWRLATFRAFLTPDSNMVHRSASFDADAAYPGTWRTNAVPKPHLDAGGNPAFSPWSRLAFQSFSFNWQALTNTGVRIETYNPCAFARVLSDDELLERRDRDVEQLVRRGAVFPRLAPDWWVLVGRAVYEYEMVTNAYPFAEAASGALGLIGTNGYVTTYAYEYSVTNGPRAMQQLSISDITLASEEGTVEGPRITFPGPGTYFVTGTDPAHNVRSNRTVVSSSGRYASTWTMYTNDVAGTWQRMANDAVKSNCLAATKGATSSYTPWSAPTNWTRWTARRIPCQPHNSAWSEADAMKGVNNFSAQGHRGGVHPISAHVVGSAIHYGWTIGGVLRFISADGTETGCVQTVGMEWQQTNGPSWFSLAAWGGAHGFPKNECDAVQDIIVHRVASGEVPPKCRPYLMKPSVAARHFGTSGVLGWSCTQHSVGIGVPVLFSQPSNTTWFSSWRTADCWPFSCQANGSGSFARLTRRDIVEEALAKDPAWNFVTPYGGDSGLPLYVELDGRFILVSHFRSVGAGPSYVTGHDIIKAYVESVGDTLLEIEE